MRFGEWGSSEVVSYSRPPAVWSIFGGFTMVWSPVVNSPTSTFASRICRVNRASGQ